MLPNIPGLGPTPETATLTFTLENEIGANEGRSSRVFLGTDLQLDATLVYKKISTTGLPDRNKFWEEARRLHEARHRHVVPIKYACETADSVYLAMPYYPGGSLHALLDKRPLTVREIVKVGLEFLMGLHHAHVEGIIHFDVKPTNIFFDASGSAALADFGLSRIVDGLGLADQPSFYRPHVVPERDYTSQLTKAADVYQAALTLFRMCVGNDAWRAQIAGLGGANSSKFEDAVRKGNFPSLSELPLHIPARLKSLLKRALHVDPDQRTPTVLDLLLELAAVDSRLDWRWEPMGAGRQEWRLKKEQSTLRLILLETPSGKWSAEAYREGVKPIRLNSRSLDDVSLVIAKKRVQEIMGKEDE